MKNKIWVNKTNSFSKAQDFDDSYYLSVSPSERLETVRFLREEYRKLKKDKDKNHESGKRLRRVLKLLNKHSVGYCIIGAFAVAFYAKPRYTKDLDILVEPSKGNARNILRVLEEFGFGEFAVSIEDLTEKGNILQLGYEPLRIDLLNKLKGFQCWDTAST